MSNQTERIQEQGAKRPIDYYKVKAWCPWCSSIDYRFEFITVVTFPGGNLICPACRAHLKKEKSILQTLNQTTDFDMRKARIPYRSLSKEELAKRL